MEPTYIIVFKNAAGKEEYFAFVRVVKFELDISLVMNVRLFDNYEKFNQQILKGETLNCGNGVDTFVEIRQWFDEDKDDPNYKKPSDYDEWIKNYDYIYKKIEESLELTFSYKRRLYGLKPVQPIPTICDMTEVTNKFTVTSASSSKSLRELKKELSESTTCEKACEIAGALLKNVSNVPIEYSRSEIDALISDAFLNMVKADLDKTEPNLLKRRDDAYSQLFDVINTDYSLHYELKNAGLNLHTLYEIHNKEKDTEKKKIAEGDVLRSAKSMADILVDPDFEKTYTDAVKKIVSDLKKLL